MDPVSRIAIAPACADRPRLPDLDLLPSRRMARDAVREALGLARGPVALTGEPGVGKTALWRGLRAGRKAGEAWAAVEASPGDGPRELYRLIAREVRVDPSGSGRVELLDFLAARSLDDERWTLAVDEAQNLDADALEEVRVLSNRLGEPDGFAAILLVGQTPLARRLLHRTGFALASRLSAHVHLRPLDAEEVGLLLQAVAPDGEWTEAAVDRVHLATGGRPDLVVERAARTGSRPARIVDATRPEVAPTREPEPLMGPSRPPIRVEDGLIEVGWASEPEPVSVSAPPSFAIEEDDPDEDAEVPAGPVERIDDHYAALQAWHEWATNQGRHPEAAPAIPGDLSRSTHSSSSPAEERSLLTTSPKVWADEEHGFSPFGRLFTRLPQENEAD